MGRHDGSTRRDAARHNNGHRAHKRTRLARLRAKAGRGRLRTPPAWGRGGLS